VATNNHVEQLWNEIVEWLVANAPPLAGFFRAPAVSSKRSRKAIRSIGYDLPDSYVHWINNCADGQVLDGPALGRGIIPNRDGKGSFALGRSKLMIDTWQCDCEQYENKIKNVNAWPGVKSVFFDPYWFAFATDESNNRGDSLAFDMNPDTPGTQGQVIFWSSTGLDRFVVFDSFEELLQRLKHGFLSKGLIYDPALETITDIPSYDFLGIENKSLGHLPPATKPQVSDFANVRLIVRGNVLLVNLQHDPIIDANLECLDGFETIDSMVEQLGGSEIENRIHAKIRSGGEIRMGVDSESEMPFCETAFELSRELTELEQTTLVEFVLDQWSDGAGEGLAIDGIAEGFLDLCPERNPTVTKEKL